jgi:acetyl esterase
MPEPAPEHGVMSIDGIPVFAGKSRKMWIDPELAALSVMMPRFDLTDLTESRRMEKVLATQGRVPTSEVSNEDIVVAGKDGNEIPIRIHRPSRIVNQIPALLYLHGGGFLLGGLHTEEERREQYARNLDCVVIGADYRLAPEHPHPAAFDDALSVLVWISDHAEELKIDPRRIAVGGNSAGGTLAAALAIHARNGEAPPVMHQMLINPALDHLSSSRSAHAYIDTPGWNRPNNLLVWDAYLLDSPLPLDYRAAPLLEGDLSDVAPASFWIAEQDPVRDEGLAYALRLMRDGVQVTIHQHLGTFHGFDSYRMTQLGQRAFAEQVWELGRAFQRE